MFLKSKLSHYLTSFILTPMLSISICHAANANTDEQQRNIKALKYLSTYQTINKKLNRLNKWSRHTIQAGPLIKNGDNKGLINIDIPLDSQLDINHNVCGDDQTVNIRQAIICTNTDGLGGNTQADKIGYSTQGKPLLAVRLGDPAGKKVMVITQQHGNEPAGTEAALRVIQWLSLSRSYKNQQIRNKLDLLVLVRANPDGGEPDSTHCAVDPIAGSVLTEQCAFIRQNVDPHAGGTFSRDSEVGFAGIVGRGYDLNRYHHVDLLNPIRPAETQAMVASILAFQPSVILDLHGDLHKTDCAIDYASIQANQVLGVLPTANCQTANLPQNFRLLSPFADAPIATDQDQLIKSLGVSVMAKIKSLFTGSVGRFSQVQLGSGNISDGATGAYQQIGVAAGGWETVNFAKDLRADVIAVTNGTPVISVNPGLPDAKLLGKQIVINTLALHHALYRLSQYADNPPTDDSGFCDYPLASGLEANLPARYWGPANSQGEQLIPISPDIGVPLFISGDCS